MSGEETLETRARSYGKSETKMASNSKKDKGSVITSETKKPVSNDDWWNIFMDLSAAVNGVKTELIEIRKIKGTVDEFTKTWKPEIDDKVRDLEVCDSNLDYRLKLLTNVVIKQEQQIQNLQAKVEAAYAREIRLNLLIHGIEESIEEGFPQLIEKIDAFFKTKLSIEQDIEVIDAYRKVKPGFKERPIMIKLRHVNDKSIIFANVSKLKGVKNARK